LKIYVSHGSVAICNNHIIANCVQSMPVKEFWKFVNNWRRYRQK